MSKLNVSKYIRGTKYTVKFPSLPNLTKVPNSIEIIQKMNSHDVFTLEYLTASEAWAKKLKTAVPVQVTWTQGTQKRVIYGYVSHVHRESASQRRTLLKITCVGASYPLKKRVRKVFSQKTIPEVAQIIAKKHGLRYVGENHPLRLTQIVISGQSEWEWLREQAKKIGYGLKVENTTMFFRPIDKLLDQSYTNVAILSNFNSQLPIGVSMMDKTLHEFQVLSGENLENTEHLRSTKHVAGVHPVTGKAFSHKKSPKSIGKKVRKKVGDVFFDEFISGQVANFATDAKLTASGAASLAKFNIPAMVKGQGDPRIRPYSTVYIEGTGKETDGYWVVNSVIHKLNAKGTYLVNLHVTTDGFGESTKAAPTSAVGTIDIQAALRNADISSDGTVSLISKTTIRSELNQGFLRTPMTWQSRSIGPRKVC